MDSNSFATPAVPYSARPPSPPTIIIPAPALSSNSGPIKVVPSYANVDPGDLSEEHLEIITGGMREQTARDSTGSWNYHERRNAQPILDFLYLGPSNVARDRTWLRENGITMLLAVRDMRMAHARLMFVDAIAEELGIKAEHIDTAGHMGMIHALPEAVRKINNHLLDVYRHQAVAPSGQTATAAEGSMLINRQEFKQGKVLVFCETGNDRSPVVVIAYMMAVLGMSMVQACQFIHYRRFCVSLSEEVKYLLVTYEGLLEARRTVNQHAVAAPHASNGKRGADDMDKDDEPGSDACPRPGLAPFVDVKDIEMDL
ncbi:dual specificity phosphatase [Apiospora phragmitis]|uniref:Dual specificity phosphatase n=1 Tax=Apiospora phragmitis TaxID=2905665 RepID=A0ABR1X6K0_9PEZI